MIASIKKISSPSQRVKIFSILSLSTAFCIAMVAYRIYYSNVDLSSLRSAEDIASSRGYTFIFLVWNLFLAWIPYWIAITINGCYQRTRSKMLAFGMIIAWLLFFPNAPYILTDLLHLHNRHPVPFWYDLMLIVSFAWTGLMLGFISLHEVRLFIKKHYSEKGSWLFTFGATILCSYGIYLGRCLRWNTWDILTKPHLLIQDIFLSVTDSMAINITVIFSVFLLLGYMTLNALIGKSEK
ncbi:MAG: putative membrane protein [Saprospiraceae bacterium]|jgi:uncharacterized membrane protein